MSRVPPLGRTRTSARFCASSKATGPALDHEDTIAEEDKVVACWTISGTQGGEYLGIPATNKKVSVDGITIHHIANGKIMDSYSNWDASA